MCKTFKFYFSKEHVATNKLDKSGAYPTYGDWLNSLDSRTIHYSEILPVQYNLNDLATKIKNKLDNTVFVLCKTETNKETGHKDSFMMKLLFSVDLELNS